MNETDSPQDAKTGASSRNKGGRKKKNPDEAYTHRFQINANETEKRQILAIYERRTLGSNKSISDFTKQVILSLEQSTSGGDYERNNSEKLRLLLLELHKIFRPLISLTTNYNQSVKKINAMFVAQDLRNEVHKANEFLKGLPELIERIGELMDTINRETAKDIIKSRKK